MPSEALEDTGASAAAVIGTTGSDFRRRCIEVVCGKGLNDKNKKKISKRSTCTFDF
jgi:hypothetical protein